MLLTDLGLSAGFLALGGRVWSDPKRLADLVLTAKRIRVKSALYALPLTLPAAAWFLHKSGAGIATSVLLVAVISVGFAAGSTAVILGAVLRLHGRYEALQLAEVLSAGARLAMSLPAAFGAGLALVASSAVAASQWVFYSRVRTTTGSLLSPDARLSTPYRTELTTSIRALAPAAIFHAVQGQLSVLIIATFGGSLQIADVGALSRFGIVLSVASLVIVQVLSPSAARAATAPHLRLILRRSLLGYALFAACGMLAAARFPHVALAVLGPDYSHLAPELVLMVASLTLGGLSTLLWAVVSARGWFEYAWVTVPLTLVTQSIACGLLPLGSVAGVLLFGMISNLPAIGWTCWIAVIGFRRLPPIS
jgi:hypothetical protein